MNSPCCIVLREEWLFASGTLLDWLPESGIAFKIHGCVFLEGMSQDCACAPQSMTCNFS